MRALTGRPVTCPLNLIQAVMSTARPLHGRDRHDTLQIIMAATDRDRHRDREPSRRQFDEPLRREKDRVFKMTHDQRQHIAKSLRHIDDARRTLEDQQSRENREIVRELKASADRIFDVLDDLEELG